MKNKIFDKKNLILLLFFIIIGAILRFYNLSWGFPYFFHPDEWNIANSINQLGFPEQMNPNFFAYGSLPIYTIYLFGVVKNIITTQTTLSVTNFNNVSYESAILISRSISAILSLLLIPLVYKIGEIMHSKSTAVLASFFTVTSVGLIQYAHFGTFEMWLTFGSVLLMLICINLITKLKYSIVFQAGVILGVLSAVKISSLALIPLPFLSYVTNIKQKHKIISTNSLVTSTLILILVTGLFFVITNPYSIVDNKSFINTFGYESNVAFGKTPVFYTQNFIGTTPIIYQFLHVFPFLLNPILTLLLIPSLMFVTWRALKTKNKNLLLLIVFFLLLFLSQAFLFVKWIRYMVPVLPFIYLIEAIAITEIYKIVKSKFINYVFISILFLVCCLYAFAYFSAVLSQPDTRITAAKWVQTHLNTPSTLIEAYDPGIAAFTSVIPNLTSCNFYELENNSYACQGKTLSETVNQTQYVLLLSQRIIQSRLNNPKQFAQGYNFYSSLLANNKYRKIYETPCDLACKILYLGDPIFSLEQTSSVFDRPTVFIFERKQFNN